MNPSGSEFTLRVVICDLVEQLKRMQHKCTYLEECRNQLVKEVIRLRLQNEWLARQVNDSPEISSLPQNIQCFCNQPNLVNNTPATAATLGHTVHCHLMNGQDFNNSSNDSQGSNRSSETSKHSNKDESIHLVNILNELDREEFENRQDSIRELTLQMLKDLDNEIKTGQLKTDLINFLKTHLQATASNDNEDELIKFDEQQQQNSSEVATTTSNNLKTDNNNSDNNQQITNISTDDYEAFNNNSDYYSNSHNLNVPLEDLHHAQNAATAATTAAKLIKSSMELTDPNLTLALSTTKYDNRKSSMTNISSKNNNSNNSNINERKINLTNSSSNNNNQAALQFINNSQSQSGGSSIDTIAQENQLISIINSVRNDLKYLHQGVLASTDKLNKIKTRQLRHFFQKQINLEHSSSSSGSTTTAAAAAGTSTIVKHQQ